MADRTKEDPLNGLGDWGLSSRTQSSSLSPGSDDLFSGIGGDDLIGNIKQSKALSELIAQMQGQQPRGTGDRFKDLSTLLPLLAGGLAAAFGGKEGQAIGAGLGLGGIQNMGVAKQQELAQRQAVIEKLEEKKGETDQSIEKGRNRISTMFNTNPDAFLNSATGEPAIPPLVLGQLMTGVNMPIYANARRTFERNDLRFTRTLDFLTDLYKNTSSVEDRVGIGRKLLGMLGDPDPDDVTLEAMAGAKSSKEFNNSLFGKIYETSPLEAIQAAIYASENGLDMSDASVLKQIDLGTIKAAPEKADDRMSRLINEVNVFQNSSVNRPAIAAIRDKVGSDESEFQRQLAIAALGNRAGDLQDYLQRQGLTEPRDQTAYAQGYKMAGDQLGYLMTMGTIDISSVFGGQPTEEQLNDYRHKYATDYVNRVNENLRFHAASTVVEKTNNVTSYFEKEFGLPNGTANSVARRIHTKAMKDAQAASKDPRGNVDQQVYDTAVEKYTDEAIQEIRTRREPK